MDVLLTYSKQSHRGRMRRVFASEVVLPIAEENWGELTVLNLLVLNSENDYPYNRKGNPKVSCYGKDCLSAPG